MDKTVEERARDALNAVFRERYPNEGNYYGNDRRAACFTIEAACRLIEQHDAFAREVSDAVSYHIAATRRGCSDTWTRVAEQNLSRFILPDPVDPCAELASVMRAAGVSHQVRDEVLAELTKRGLSIVPTVDGEGVK